MQISPAIAIAFSAIARASRSVLPASALAAASAYGPPDPIATMPSSGSIRSPLPDSRNVARLVQHDQHRFEPAQDAVAPPVLGELDGGALEIAAILLQLRFEPGEQREGIGGRAGKPGEDPVVVQTADLAGALLDDGLAERHLAVAGQHGPVAVPHAPGSSCCETSSFLTLSAGTIRVSRKRDGRAPRESPPRPAMVVKV